MSQRMNRRLRRGVFSRPYVPPIDGVVDLDPDPFAFTPVTNATPGQLYASNIVTISGISGAAGTSISTSGGAGAYRRNGGAYSSDLSTILNGDTLQAQLEAPATGSAAAMITVGGFSAAFVVTSVGKAQLTRKLWGYGSSSLAGNGGTNWNLISKIAALFDPAYTVEAENGAISYGNRRYVLPNGKMLVNHGVGANTMAQQKARWDAEKFAFAADDFFIIHIGDNDGGIDSDAEWQTCKTGIMAEVADIQGLGPFLVLVNTRGGLNQGTSAWPERPGSAPYYSKERFIATYSALWPGRVHCLYHALIDEAADWGLQNANDQADIDIERSPRGFMAYDGGHQGDPGYELNGTILYKAVDAHEGGTPYAFRQFKHPVSPAAPAIGDQVGQIDWLGKWNNTTNTMSLDGGTMALDASNTQADYDVSASGLLTRKTAIIPARDVTEVRVKFSKAGYPDKVQKRIYVGELAAPGESKWIEFDGYSALYASYAHYAPISLAKGTLIFRVQNILGNRQQRVAPGMTIQANGGFNLSLGSIINCDFGTQVFNASGSPYAVTAGRWVAAAWDIPNGILKLAHWVNPAAPTVPTNGATANTFLASNPGYTINFDGAGRGFGNSAFSTTTDITAASLGMFRLGDFAIFPDYFDISQQAVKEKFSVNAAEPTPSAAWRNSADGSVDGVVPMELWRGRAANMRRGINMGTAPLFLAFSSIKNPTTGERGFLMTR